MSDPRRPFLRNGLAHLREGNLTWIRHHSQRHDRLFLHIVPDHLQELVT